MSSVHIIYASTSGHTEYVVDTLLPLLQAAGVTVTKMRVEKAKPEDVALGDVLVLASSTWNTGGAEGQLNPHMHAFVYGSAKSVDLKGKKVAVIALGDDRYRYTARAGDHLLKFISSHGGTVLGEQLTVINEPYGQEKKIQDWAQTFISQLAT